MLDRRHVNVNVLDVRGTGDFCYVADRDRWRRSVDDLTLFKAGCNIYKWCVGFFVGDACLQVRVNIVLVSFSLLGGCLFGVDLLARLLILHRGDHSSLGLRDRPNLLHNWQGDFQGLDLAMLCMMSTEMMNWM